MVYTETMTVPVDSRNTLIRNRDDIKGRLGVEMYFPRSEVRGAYQDMVLKGTTGTVPRAIREVNNILASWKDEYEAFRERKRARRMASRQTTSEVTWPSLPMNKEKLRVVSNNMFDVLAVDEVTIAKETPEKVSGPKAVKPKAAKLTGWAAMAAKPAKPVAVPVAEQVETSTAVNILDFTTEEMSEFDAELLEWNEERKLDSMKGVSWGDEDAWAD